MIGCAICTYIKVIGSSLWCSGGIAVIVLMTMKYI